MKTFRKYSKALLLLLVSLLTFAATSCSDDETGGWDGTYGYVQFKLSKKVSSRATRAAALDKLEKLDDAKKIKVVSTMVRLYLRLWCSILIIQRMQSMV